MPGTQTKFLAALMLLVNALVLLNVRRAGPELPRAADGASDSLGGRYGNGNRVLDLNPAAGAADVAGTTPVAVAPGQGGVGYQEGKESRSSGGGVGTVERGAAAALNAGAGGGGLRASSAAAEPATEDGRGGNWVGREEKSEPDILVRQATQRDKETEECMSMMETLNVVPNVSWGKASRPQQQRWDQLGCNGLVERAERAAQGGGGGDLELPDCTAQPSTTNDPLIAVCAGSTTRGVPYPDEHSLALFRFLLPSMARTAECGFRYLAVVGYDVGDGFFDGAAGRAKTLGWFESEVSGPAAMRGLSLELQLVRVDNPIKKPGPVFTAATKAAYNAGAHYIYRVNDDSEMHTPWARSFVGALEAMGPPYGVVGPESLNNNILVHDFTHRLHMDIFEQQYYPASLTDWYVDDWISRVYGNARTIRAKNCKVEHHTGAHGQRYEADTSKSGSLNGLVAVGARKISAWAEDHGAEAAAREILAGKLDGKSAKKAYARDIP